MTKVPFKQETGEIETKISSSMLNHENQTKQNPQAVHSKIVPKGSVFPWQVSGQEQSPDVDLLQRDSFVILVWRCDPGVTLLCALVTRLLGEQVFIPGVHPSGCPPGGHHSTQLLFCLRHIERVLGKPSVLSSSTVVFIGKWLFSFYDRKILLFSPQERGL